MINFFLQQLYAISELAQELIRLHAKARQWSLLSYPGKVKLPGDIFRPLPSDATRSTVRLNFLFDILPLMTICYRSSKKPISPNIFLSYSMNQQLRLQKWGLITLKASINNLIYPNRNENPQLNVKHLDKQMESRSESSVILRAYTMKLISFDRRTRGPNKKRKRRRVDDDDDDDVDDDGEDSDDRIETDDDIKGASSPNRTAPIESDSDEGIEEGSNDETNEDLGRGARTRAKVCNLSPVR